MERVKKIMVILLTVALVIPGMPANTAKGAVFMTEEEVGEMYAAGSQNPNYSRVSVHDPSIVVGYYEGDTYTASAKVYGEQNLSLIHI